MLFFRDHFHFLKNREMDSLYLAIALLLFGEGLISVFVPIYFWEIGFPIWKIIFFYFLISFSFLISTFLMVPLLKMLSDKMMMFLSIPFVVLYFLGLSYIAKFPFLFYLLPLVLALNLLLFNVGYHLSFSAAADGEYIGREIGMRHLVSDVVTFSAPFFGGLLIAAAGFQFTFFVASIFLFSAILPLFFFPRRQVSPAVSAGKIWDFLRDKRLMPFTISGIGFANEKMIAVIVWPLFLFFQIGGVREFGGVVSLGLFASAIITFLVGFLSDQGRRRRLLRYSTWVFSAIWFGRVFLKTPFAFVGSHVLGNMANSSLMVTWSSQYYKIARALGADSQPGGLSSFILSREVLYHTSRVIFLPILILFSYLFPLYQFFYLSFILAAAFTLLFLYANRMPHPEDLWHPGL